MTARGGRGLNIITALADEWGVRDCGDEVTVWAALSARRDLTPHLSLAPELGSVGDLAPRRRRSSSSRLRPDLGVDLDHGLAAGLGPGLDFADLDDLDELDELA